MIFTLGAAIFVFVGKVSFGFGLALGFLPLSFALMGMVRRLFLPQFLELRQDTLLISTGFFQTRVAKIPYADIEQTSEVKRGRMTTFYLRTKERAFEITSILLPNMASFVAVRDFINLRVAKKKGHSRRSKPASIASDAVMKATERFTIPMEKLFGVSKHCTSVRTIRMGCFDCPILLSMTSRTKSCSG